ncbi:MAG: hypothetical protein ACTTHM_09285 [Peptoanaerobacter stomatis]
MLKKLSKAVMLFSTLCMLLFVSFNISDSIYSTGNRGEIELLNIVEG